MKKLYLILSAAALAWLPIQAQADAVYDLPFYESFPDTTRLGLYEKNPKWDVLDRNTIVNTSIMYTWSFSNDLGFDGKKGYAFSACDYIEVGNDYLVTKPILMEAGTINLSFYYRRGIVDGQEALDVFFGESSLDVAAMKQVVDLPDIRTEQWTLCYTNIEVPVDGMYRIAFRAKSPALANQVRIDDIRIERGEYQPVSELAVVHPLLPINGCSLTSEETLGLVVTNTGMAEMEGFTASYVINGDERVQENFTNNLEPGDTLTVYFTQKADLSTLNTAYAVEMQAASADQLYQFNDTCHGIVRNIEATSVPYSVTFTDKTADSFDLFWWPTDPKANGWMFYKNVQKGNYYQPFEKDSVPLMSGCFALDAGSYDLIFKWETGTFGSPKPYTTDVIVLMGESGVSIEQWDTIAYEKELYTTDDFKKTVVVKDPGNYSFAIICPRGQKDLQLFGISLETTPAYDVAIVGARPKTYPRLLPIDQLTDTKITVQVENRGSQTEQVILEAFQGEASIVKSDVLEVPKGKVVSCELPLAFKNIAIETQIDLIIKASIENEDAKPADNLLQWSFTVSEEETAYDDITTFDKHRGDEKFAYGVGHVFDMSATDTLTSVKVAFAELETAVPFVLNVFEVDETNVARILYRKELVRSKEAGFQEFPVTPLLFEQGRRYFIEIEQPDVQYVGLCYESNQQGVFHMRYGWDYSEAFYNPDSLATHTGSYFGIRPMFGANVIPVAVDMEAVNFELPLDSNLMLAEEPVRVIYNSLGFKAQENVTFRCLVDGVETATDVVTIKPYEQSFAVNFVVDLTALGEHELTVYSDLETDTNHANDTIRKTVKSLAEVDPYKLDFESCSDFATDRLNPEWQSVDKDGGITLGYAMNYMPVSWPGIDKPFSFIAFNQDKTVPASTGFFEGYTGKRFGASFNVEGHTGVANDDWLISPKLALGEKPLLKFRVKSQTDAYGLEEYYVLVSTTGTNEDDFEEIGGLRQAPVDWETVQIDLSDYKNQELHVAIRCVSTDKFIFLIDDIEVVKNADRSGVNDVVSPCTLFVDPLSETLHIHAGETLREVVLYDISGQQLKSVPVSADNCTISLAGLSTGVYACRIYTNTGRMELGKFAVK